MALLSGRIKSVFDTIKYLWNRINQRTEGNLAVSEWYDLVTFTELERTRRKLVQMRSKTEGVTSTGSFAIDSVRRRMTAEISVGSADMNTSRKKTKEAMNKWFMRDDQVDTGSFCAIDFEHRMKEVYSEDIERPLEPLPAVEDTFMAFSRAEYDLFDEDRSTLSGVHYKVDLREDFEETYTMPLLPMYTGEQQLDFTPTAQSFDPEDTIPPDEHDDAPASEFTGNNPMLKVLGELEERIAANAQRPGAFWVAE